MEKKMCQGSDAIMAPISWLDRHEHFADAYDPLCILGQALHLAQLFEIKVGVVVALGGQGPADVSKPFETIVLEGRWWAGGHKGSVMSSSGVMSFGVS
jgi:hypothetical protein